MDNTWLDHVHFIMGVSEPTGYENEPEERFLPLPSALYPTLFDHEMAGQTNDCMFYDRLLKENDCKKVLELGCGTGRMLRYLMGKGYRTTGIDLSRSMLCHNKTGALVAQMRMEQLGFAPVFDAVIIPQNTLNLLRSEKRISQCLKEIRAIVTGPKLLITHLFIPDARLLKSPGKKHFQFSIFDLDHPKKLIKESLRHYDPAHQQLVLEERYKFRDMDNSNKNRNYTNTLTLAAFSKHKWVDIFYKNNFTILQQNSTFNENPEPDAQSTTLLFCAKSMG